MKIVNFTLQIALFFIISYLVFGLFSAPAYALVNFGGSVGAVRPCLNGLMFKLIPASGSIGGTYLFRWGTLLYKWWRPPRPGLNVLGKAMPAGICWIPSTPPKPLPVSFTVIFMGTSQ